MSSTEPRKPLWRRVTGSVWFHFVAAIVVAGLLSTFVAKLGYITSGSMENTLQVRDRVLIDRISLAFSDPQPGDVVVFDVDVPWDGPREAETNPLKIAWHWLGATTGIGPTGPNTLIKRVIAGPGQAVECCSVDGAVVVDGVPLDEPYIHEDLAFSPGSLDCDTTPRSPRCFDEVVVPEGSYLMLGDHRSRSSDSAAYCRVVDAPADCGRWAERDGIVGKATAILWPVSRWGTVE